MSLHVTKKGAHKRASALQTAKDREAVRPGHSSGHRFTRYGVRPKGLLWEVYTKP